VHAALIDVEAFLKNFVIVAVFLMLLAVLCVLLAATPSFYERWDTRKAGEYYYGHRGMDFQLPVSSVDQKVWAFWQKTGFSVFTKGKEDFFKAEIPQLDCTSPLSEAVFKFLQEEIRTLARKIRDENLNNLNLVSTYYSNSLVHDSTYINTFQKGLCTSEVVSLKEYWCFYPDGASHEGIGIIGRNFVLNGSAMQEIELKDLFDESSGRDWFAVLAKEVEADLRRQGYSSFDEYLPFEEFGQFLITGEGLKIIFQNYAFSSGIHGFPVAYVSWDLMAPFLKPDAPVTRWYEEQLQKR
jgi:hypothetical protein